MIRSPKCGCREGSGDSEPLDTGSAVTTTGTSTTGASTSAGLNTGGATTGGATVSGGDAGTTGDIAGAGTTGLLATSTTGADPQASTAASGPAAGTASSGVGGAGTLTSATTTATPDYTFAGVTTENGCACRAAGAPAGRLPAAWAPFGLLVTMTAGWRSRRRRANSAASLG